MPRLEYTPEISIPFGGRNYAPQEEGPAWTEAPVQPKLKSALSQTSNVVIANHERRLLGTSSSSKGAEDSSKFDIRRVTNYAGEFDFSLGKRVSTESTTRDISEDSDDGEYVAQDAPNGNTVFSASHLLQWYDSVHPCEREEMADLREELDHKALALASAFEESTVMNFEDLLVLATTTLEENRRDVDAAASELLFLLDMKNAGAETDSASTSSASGEQAMSEDDFPPLPQLEESEWVIIDPLQQSTSPSTRVRSVVQKVTPSRVQPARPTEGDESTQMPIGEEICSMRKEETCRRHAKAWYKRRSRKLRTEMFASERKDRLERLHPRMLTSGRAAQRSELAFPLMLC